MARIKLYQSQARAPGARGAVTSRVRFTAADFSSEALGKSIKQVFDVKQIVDKKARQDERNGTEKFLAETRLNWTQKMATDMEQASLRGDGASGFTENLMTSFDDYVENNSSSGSDEDNRYRRTKLTQMQAGLLGPSARCQARESGMFKVQTLKTAQASYMPEVYTNPDNLDPSIEGIRETAERLGMSGPSLESHVKSVGDELGKMTLTGIIDRMTPKEANDLHNELLNGQSDWLTKIDGNEVNNMARYAKTRASATTKMNEHNNTMFNNSFGTATQHVAKGYPVSAETINRLSTYIDGMEDDPKKVIAVQKLLTLRAKTETVQNIQKLTVPVATAAANGLEATARKQGSSDLDREIAIAARNTVKRMQADAKDPIAMATRAGEIEPVDIRHPESLKNRGEEARGISLRHDVPFKFFSEEELISVTNQFESMSPIEQAQLADRIVDAAGSDAIPVMAEFKKINPNLAVMGSLLGTHRTAFSKTAQIIARGADLSKKNDLMTGSAYQEVMIEIRNKLQPVLIETGGDNLAAYTKAAMAFYLGKGGMAVHSDGGRTLDFDGDLVEEAASSVLGHPTTNNIKGEAFHKVEAGDLSSGIVLPFDVTGEEYDNAIGFMDDDDLLLLSETGGVPVYKGARITAENLIEGAVPVVDSPLSQLEPGEIAYAFRDSEGNLVQDDTGKIFHLILSAETIDELMLRKVKD